MGDFMIHGLCDQSMVVQFDERARELDDLPRVDAESEPTAGAAAELDGPAHEVGVPGNQVFRQLLRFC